MSKYEIRYTLVTDLLGALFTSGNIMFPLLNSYATYISCYVHITVLNRIILARTLRYTLAWNVKLGYIIFYSSDKITND